jgi:hypothetical protein
VNGFGPGGRDHACPALRETAPVYSRSGPIRCCHVDRVFPSHRGYAPLVLLVI